MQKEVIDIRNDFLAEMMHELASDAVTEIHRLGSLNSINSFLKVLKSKDLVSVASHACGTSWSQVTCLLAVTLQGVLLCLHAAESFLLHVGHLFSWVRDQPSCPFNLRSSSLCLQIYWRLGLQYKKRFSPWHAARVERS